MDMVFGANIHFIVDIVHDIVYNKSIRKERANRSIKPLTIGLEVFRSVSDDRQ